MSELKIITNYQPRDLLMFHELTEQEQKEVEDRLIPLDDGMEFFRYRENVYSLSEFMRVGPNSPFPKYWEGYHADSFFSGVLIKQVNDGMNERIICALYLS